MKRALSEFTKVMLRKDNQKAKSLAEMKELLKIPEVLNEQRRCLRCGLLFSSHNRGNRICRPCKGLKNPH